MFPILDTVEAQTILKEKMFEDDGFEWFELKKDNNGKRYYGIADRDGKIILSPEYDGFIYYLDDVATFSIKSNNYEGILSKNGEWIIPLTRKYEEIYSNKRYYSVKKDGREGICNLSGKEIITPTQEYKYIAYYLGGFWGLSDDKIIPLNINLNGDKMDNSKFEEYVQNKENATIENFEKAKLMVYEALIFETAFFDKIRPVIDILLEQENLSELIYMKSLCYYKEGNVKQALKELKRNRKLTKSKKINEYDPNSEIYKNHSMISLYREEAQKYMKYEGDENAIPILKWFTKYDSTPYSHFLLAGCYYRLSNLKKAEKHYSYAQEIAKDNYPVLSGKISKILEHIRTLREIKRQQNLQIFAQVATAALVVGATATQSYMQSQKSSSTTNSQYNTKSQSNTNNQSKSDDNYYEYEWKCYHCNGTGRAEINKSLSVGGFGIKIEKVTCPECGKTYDKNSTVHKHETCSKCNGKGTLKERKHL